MKIDKTYSISLEIEGALLWYDMTISLFDELIDKKSENARALHLLWKSDSGGRFEFDCVHVIWPNLGILKDVDLLKHFVEITPRTQPREIEHRLKTTMGFVRRVYISPSEPRSWSDEDLSLLAQEYGIEVLTNESTYQHDGHTYHHPAWTTRQDEAYMRIFFAGIVGESKRRRAFLQAGRDYLRELLFRADSGDLIAYNEIIEIGVTRTKEAYGISNLVLLQYVREAFQKDLNKSLAAPYPYQDLSYKGHRVVQTATLKVYSVLQPWLHTVDSVGGSVVTEVMNYYGELEEGALGF